MFLKSSSFLKNTNTCIKLGSPVVTNAYKDLTYCQYRVFVDNEYAQHAESDRLSIQTAQKYIYLHIYRCLQKENLKSFQYYAINM